MSSVKSLQITYLRNLIQAKLNLSPGINLLYGENGSGKTSVLEAISLLGLGRSFRSHKTRSLINHQQSELTVFAELAADHGLTTVGIQKQRNGASVIRINRDNAPSASHLARQLPLQIINADSFQLIEGSPLQRRQFMDWLVFHVKPEFVEVWSRLQRVTKQRNSLLRRDKITRFELAPWDEEYVRLGVQLDNLRTSVFAEFIDGFQLFDTQEAEKVLQDVELEYQRGWPVDQPLGELLAADFDRDCRDGYTHHGPHRADIKIKAAGHRAADVLSRGQEKLVVCALHIAQAQFFQEKTKQVCTFLIDDLLAELDVGHATRLAKWLSGLGGQVFITGVSRDGLLKIWQEQGLGDTDIALFHVEQGSVSPVN